MPKARKYQISLDATPYYHCMSRCVRRAFLCGEDAVSGRSYEHRRQWVEDRILEVAAAFCVDVCAYAVMSNHLHVVLHVNRSTADALGPYEICELWHSLFKGTELTSRFLKHDALTTQEHDVVVEKAEQWRQNLSSISWFMRCVNEPIARMANAEDQCTGSFWESRFKCQALLDEKALAACMAYVDLNPIRAKFAPTPEASDHTSIKERLTKAKTENQQPPELFPFVGNPRQDMPQGLPFRLEDYLQLVDWTGRILREDKRGAMSSALPDILTRLDFEPKTWLTLTQKFESKLQVLVGRPETVQAHAGEFGYKRSPSTQNVRQLFS